VGALLSWGLSEYAPTTESKVRPKTKSMIMKSISGRNRPLHKWINVESLFQVMVVFIKERTTDAADDFASII
jgi:hypothetical protein